MIALLTIAALCSTTPTDFLVHAESSSPNTRTIPDLVRDLGAANFTVREQSEETLRYAGEAAIPFLDRLRLERSERGIRAERVARAIRVNTLRTNAQRAAEGDVQFARRLPMWNRFTVVGLSEQQRASQLGKMMNVVADCEAAFDAEYFDANDDDRTRTERKSARLSRVFRNLTAMKFSYRDRSKRVNCALAALLYGGHASTVLYTEDGMTLRLLLSSAEANTARRSDVEQKTLNWLMTHYVANLPNEGKAFALPSVLQFDLPNTASMCRIILEHGVSSRELAQSAAVLSASGVPADIELLTPLFERSDMIRSGFGGRYKSLGSIALLSAILLTDQDPGRYGYSNVVRSSTKGFNYLEIKAPRGSGFDAAVERWKKWEQDVFREAPAAPVRAIIGWTL